MLPEMNDGFVHGHFVILAEIGAHDQARSVEPVGAVHDNHLLRVIFVELLHDIDNRPNDTLINRRSMTLQRNLQVGNLG